MGDVDSLAAVHPQRLPARRRVRRHYRNFTQGPLSAYLHLCWEQNLDDNGRGGYIAHLEQLCAGGAPNAETARKWIDGLGWWEKVASDQAAVYSLQAMLHDIDLRKDNPIQVRTTHVDQRIREHIKLLAAELNLPADPAAMTVAQQYTVLDRLDGYVKRVDPELWRTKQISDFMGGIWAQVFAPPYNILLVPYLRMTQLAPWVCLSMLALAVLVRIRRTRKRAADQNADADELQPTAAAFASPA